MENEFVPFEIALALKELGFNENCVGFYSDEHQLRPVSQKSHKSYSRIIRNISLRNDAKCTAPLYQQVFRWFRDKYKLEASIQRMPPEVYGKGKGDIKNYLVYIWAELLNPRGQTTLNFDTYEEAELECLKKLIEIIKNKNEQNR
jgi:hypothetical protein